MYRRQGMEKRVPLHVVASNFLEAVRVGYRMNRMIDWSPTGWAPRPTDAPPGSQRKIMVMSWRLEQGYHLWHPLDARAMED